MMNKNKTFYLIFVTLLALSFNTAFMVYLLDISYFLKAFELSLTSFIGMILVIAVIGASTSLFFSEIISRFTLGVTLIKRPTTYLEKWLFTSVERQSRQLGIPMPQIGVFYASDLNAFTAGRGAQNAMFAVSSGLLETLDQDELEAVIGHELAHIENGDMVSLAMAQGMVVILTELPARLFGFLIDHMIFKKQSHGGVAYLCVYWPCMFLMGLLPHFVVMWFSRRCEFSADKTSSSLNGGEKLISALQRLSQNKSHPLFLKQITAIGQNSIVLEGLVENVREVRNVFSSHPPLNKRIRVIKKHSIDYK